MDTLTMPPPPVPPRAAASAKPVISDENAAPRARAGARWGTALLVALVVGLGVSSLALALRKPATAQTPRYQTETVTRGRVTGVLHAAGYLEPTATVRVGAEVTGRVSSVAVGVGERVRRGQPLARLDVRALRADAVGAEAQALAAQLGVKHAEVRLGQIVYLLQHVADKSPPRGREAQVSELEAAAIDAEAELVTAAADLERHKASLFSRRAQLAAATLRAPMDGVVVRRGIEPGETVAAGAPLFEIAAPPSELRLLATVGEGDVGRVRSGPVVFSVPALPGKSYEALVVAVDPAPQGDRPPFHYRVRLLARNPEQTLRPGMTAVVALPIESASEALVVSLDALRYAPSPDSPLEAGAAVHVLDSEARPLRVPVELGVTDGAFVEIRGTRLKAGAPVIVTDSRR